jgi:hypothetical protein
MDSQPQESIFNMEACILRGGKRLYHNQTAEEKNATAKRNRIQLQSCGTLLNATPTQRDKTHQSISKKQHQTSQKAKKKKGVACLNKK